MYCRHCGQQLDDRAAVCPACGVPINETHTLNATVSVADSDEGICWPWGILGFFVPLVGLILFAAWRKEQPRRSKACGIGALVFICFEVLLILTLALCSAFGLMGNGRKSWDIVRIPEEYRDSIYRHGDLWGEGFALTYESSDDGVISLANCGAGSKMQYDEATDSVIAFYEYGFAVFNRTSGEKILSRTTSLSIKDVSVYDGTMCVAFAENACRIDIYDLTTGELQSAICTKGNVGELIVTNRMVIYAEDGPRSNVYALDLGAGTEQHITYAYYPALGISHESGILYIVERHIASSNLYFVELADLNIRRVAESGDYAFNVDGVYFDGENVHAFGNVYSATTGYMIASRGYVENIEAENLDKTLCANTKYALISTFDGKTVMYDKTQEKITYTAELQATRIYAVSESLFVAECGNAGTFATIDLSKV